MFEIAFEFQQEWIKYRPLKNIYVDHPVLRAIVDLQKEEYVLYYY